jgi:hypothetical protein
MSIPKLSVSSFSGCGACSAEKTKTDKSVFDEQVGALSGNYQLHENCNSRDRKLFVNPPNGVRQSALNAGDAGRSRQISESLAGEMGPACRTMDAAKTRCLPPICANHNFKNHPPNLEICP